MKIICSFKEVGEFEPTVMPIADARKKLGRYSGGNLNVEGFGYKNWVVLAYLVPQKPIVDYLKEGMTKQQIVDGCVDFLNQPPTKRSRKSKYGKLSCTSFYFLEGKISVSLVIDQKNSKYFWGKGTGKYSMYENYSKRGRPPKGRSKG